jgi:hypothetical protein
LHIHQFSKNSIQSYAQYSPLQSELTKRVEKLICDGTEELVKRCWIPAPEGQAVLRSTRLTGPGVFDAKLILGDPFAFSWICCLLATRVLTCTRSALPHAGIELRGKPLRGEFRILACTQNGVAISAGVLRACDILNQDDEAPRIAGIDVIDTFGPPQRYIEQYSYASSEPILSYLYIGDFAIAGTELKLAQLHAFHSSTKLLKAFAIGSLQRPSSDQQASNGLDLDTLILLSKLPLTDRNGDPIVLKYTFGDATETLPHE